MDDSVLWKNVSSDAQDLVRKLLDKNPIRRPNASEALNHPWFQTIASEYKPR